jgi:uncharacterized membrane protein
MTPTLNDTEADVLDMLKHIGYPPERWLRPMDIGRPSSFVHRGLTGLVKKGLVERKSRGASTAYVYRLKQVGQ